MSTLASRRLLVVDDEPSICRALALALGRRGIEVLAAHSSEAALTLLREQRLDALVLDLRIPDLRGDVLYELAASIQPHLAARTLFMTGDITERAQELVTATRCPYVRKPFDLLDLVGAVAALLPRESPRVSVRATA